MVSSKFTHASAYCRNNPGIERKKDQRLMKQCAVCETKRRPDLNWCCLKTEKELSHKGMQIGRTQDICYAVSSIVSATVFWLWAQQLSRYSDWATGWTVWDRIPVATRFSARPDQHWGPPRLLYNGYRVFPGGKVRPERAADHSPPSSAAVMEE